MPSERSRRKDLATAGVGATALGAGGALRHAGVERAVGPGGTYPRVHGTALLPKGAQGRKLYLAGTTLGLFGAPALAAGSVGLTSPKGKKVETAKADDKPSLLREGLTGSGEALISRGQSLTEPVPTRVRAAQAGVAVGAGAAGSGLARLALKSRGGRTKAVVSPVAAGLAAAGTLPLSNQVVRRAGKGEYVVTPTGVKRAKTPPKRPSAKASVQRGGSLRQHVVPSDERFSKADPPRQYDELHYARVRRALKNDPKLNAMTQEFLRTWNKPPVNHAQRELNDLVAGFNRSQIRVAPQRAPRPSALKRWGPVAVAAATLAMAYHQSKQSPWRKKPVRKADRDYLAQRGAVTAAGGVPGIGAFTQAAAAARYAPPGQQKKHAARQFGMGPAAGVAAGGAAAYGLARYGDRPDVARRAEAFQAGRKAMTGRLRTAVGMSAEGKPLSHYSPRAGKALQAVKASRFAKPFATPGRAAVGGAAFLGAKALVGGAGGQTAITLNQRDQKRYKTGPTGVRKVATGGQTKAERHDLATKKRVSAVLSGVGGGLGIGGGVAFLRGKKNAALGLSTLGGFTGGANALLNVPIQRKEAKAIDPVRKGLYVAQGLAKRDSLEIRHGGEHKRLLSQYGDRGPLPKGLDRDTKMKAYEARYAHHGGPKQDRWRTRAKAGETVQNAGLGVATLGGAAYLLAQTKRGGRVASRISPRARRIADNVSIGGAVAGGAGTIGAGYAHRKQSSYANSPGGVAASALRRMRDYDPEQ